MEKLTVLVLILLCMAWTSPAEADGHAVKTIRLNARSSGRVFEGIGAVSAGGSSRLLPDYAEPQRSQILDYLFKPKFGAGFQHLKVEIGCGENSTCGSEPSHVITASELSDPKPRGYELWLMSEARKRNPKIMLDCLPWGYPNWVGTRFSHESAEWIASFLSVARKYYNLDLNWIAAGQNENGTDLNWICKDLRPALDARGFSKVKLQAPDDDSEYWEIFDQLEKNPKANDLISAVGYHYLDGREPWDIEQKVNHDATAKAKSSGKPLWASEEWSQSGAKWEGTGALYLARLMNKLYTRNRTTKFEIWCPIDSIYDQIDWPDTGVMQADTPWSGYYAVWPAVWAVAHTTQFASPGWVYMDSGCGQLNPASWKGSYVALRDRKTEDWSLIVCTGDATKISLFVDNNLSSAPVNVWRSNAKEQFHHLPNIQLLNGKCDVSLEPNSIYTFSTSTGQRKGTFENSLLPKREPFPLPFTETFEVYKDGDSARYFSDQKGTFEVAKRTDGRGHCLAQIVPEQGILWYDNRLLKPHTLFGDTNWSNCTVEADVLVAGGDVEVGGRFADRNKLGYRLILARDGRWQLNWQNQVLAGGQLDQFDSLKWHHLRLGMVGSRIAGSVDGKEVTSVQDSSGKKGMAFLASTYDHNCFDDVRVLP